MTHLAEVQPGDIVFETGTDSGYQAAVLSKLAAHVYSVEVIEPLADHAAPPAQGSRLRQCRRPGRRRLLRLAGARALRRDRRQGGDRPPAAAPAQPAQARRPHGDPAGSGGRTAVADPGAQGRGRQAAPGADHAGALLAAAGRRAAVADTACACAAQRPSRYQAKPSVPSSSSSASSAGSSDCWVAPVTR